MQYSEKPSLESCNALFNAFRRQLLEVEITESRSASIGYITFEEGFAAGGRSRKARNVLYNWKKFFDTITEIALNVSGEVPQFLIPFVALKAFISFSKLRVIEITPEHGLLLAILWRNRRNDGCVHANDCISEISEEFKFYFGKTLPSRLLCEMLSTLDQMRIIKLMPSGWIFLCERVIIESKEI